MTPAELHFKPSRYLRRIVYGLHALAGVTALSLPWWLWMPAWLGIAIHFFCYHRQPCLAGSMQALPDGKVILIKDKRSWQAEIMPSSLITAWLMVLHLRHDAGRVSLVLVCDSAAADTLCQWRSWLRWTVPALQRRLKQAADEKEQGA